MNHSNLTNTDKLAPFFSAPKVPIQTSEGLVDLPICYYDSSAVINLFTTDKEEVKRRLEGTGLEPINILGSPLVAVICFEYRDTEIGPYNEVVIAVATRPYKKSLKKRTLTDLFRSLKNKQSGIYAIDLPVSKSLPCAAGIEIWGFPKIVAPIKFQLNNRSFSCSVNDADGATNIMRLSGTSFPFLTLPSIDTIIYTIKQRIPLRTLLKVRGKFRLRNSSFLKLTVGTSDHPVANNLRKLGLDGARPFATLSTESLRLVLPKGVEFS